MKISRKSDYALRAVLYIARQTNDKRSSINAIAESERVPRDFLAKILKELTRAEILKSYQGVHGGYQLSRPAAQISVLDVIEAMDGPLGVNLCVRGETGCDCDRSDRCATHPYWKKVQVQLRNTLKSETFAKLRRASAKK